MTPPVRSSGSNVAAFPPATNLLTVTFMIGPQQYGLPVGVVLEVVRLPALISLAGAPPVICGLLNLRGQYLPILDGRTLVGEPTTYDLNSQIVIAGHATANFGILVDQVRDVYQLDQSQRSTIPRNTAAPFLQSVINSERGSVLLFDFDALCQIINETSLDYHHTHHTNAPILPDAEAQDQEGEYEQTTSR